MDLTPTIAPKSDQLNADDLLSGPRTVTIAEVRRGTAEQPVELHLDGLNGRPYKPGKSMRRVLVAAWGSEGNDYVGRSLTLYTDPNVKFGGQDVGGIRISHMSDITAPLKVALTVTRGKKAPFVVQPLKNAAAATQKPTDKVQAALTAIGNATTPAELGKIADYARNIGIDTARQFEQAMTAKRTELEARA